MIFTKSQSIVSTNQKPNKVLATGIKGTSKGYFCRNENAQIKYKISWIKKNYWNAKSRLLIFATTLDSDTYFIVAYTTLAVYH
jgi:hypothetical protein